LFLTDWPDLHSTDYRAFPFTGKCLGPAAGSAGCVGGRGGRTGAQVIRRSHPPAGRCWTPSSRT